MYKETKYNLKKMLSNYSVVIPAVQRDYAFGRLDVVNVIKRKSFVKYLIDSLKNNSKMHLDFVYGKKEDSRLILLDGQQRITTLWLLQIYLSKKFKSLSRDYVLENFTYDTRASSRDFCAEIIKDDIDFDDIFCQIENNQKEVFQQKLEYIKNQKWFFNSWQHDPTIMGMCVMLIEINDIVNSYSDFEISNADLDKITFSFLEIKNLGQPEELYVKMNSRGKQLTKWA